jgi:hypothetical protein
MNETGIAIVAVCVAAGMAVLVQTGVNPGLRAAFRTTVVLPMTWDQIELRWQQTLPTAA